MAFKVIASSTPMALTRLGQICLAIAGISVLAVGGALAVEHIGGIAPCPLCLDQRIVYYAAIPLALIALALVPGNIRLCRIILAILAVGFLVNAGLGIYHSGIEWGWWAGPQGCSGAATIAKTPGALLESLKNPVVIRCDEAALRVLGVSLAGYSALVSALLAAVSALGAAAGQNLAR
jgi:disulfide bond formation protein DsbB